MKKRVAMTVCFLLKEDSIILGLKKCRIGEGLYNGFGGHLKKGETIGAAAIREVEEETGVRVHDIEHAGVVLITYEDSDQETELHVFISRDFTGEPRASDEMIPEEFLLTKIPYDKMWPGDRYYLPLAINGKTFIGHIRYSGQKTRRLIKIRLLY